MSPATQPDEISGLYEFIYLFTFCLNKNLTVELKFNWQKPKLRSVLQVLFLIFYLIRIDEQGSIKTPLVILSNIAKQQGPGLLLKQIFTKIFPDRSKENTRQKTRILNIHNLSYLG